MGPIEPHWQGGVEGIAKDLLNARTKMKKTYHADGVFAMQEKVASGMGYRHKVSSKRTRLGQGGRTPKRPKTTPFGKVVKKRKRDPEPFRLPPPPFHWEPERRVPKWRKGRHTYRVKRRRGRGYWSKWGYY